MQLAGGAAGAGVAHGPEVGLLAHAQDALRRQADLVLPHAVGQVVVQEYGGHQPLAGHAEDRGQGLPGVVDGLALEVVAKGEVAQHLEEGVVAGRRADLLQVVVLAADAHALLAAGRADVGPLLQAQEGVLEGHHARVDEEQRVIAVGHHGRAGHEGVSLLLEEVKKSLADLRRSGWSGDLHAGAVFLASQNDMLPKGQREAFYAMWGQMSKDSIMASFRIHHGKYTTLPTRK